MDLATTVAVGVGSGLVASALFWVLQFRAFRPQVELAPTIAKLKWQSSEARYQIKFRNKGRRDAYDVRVTMICYVTGLLNDGIQEVLVVGEWNRPVLRARRWLRYTLHFEEMPDRTRYQYLANLPRHLRERVERREYVNVEEFLSIGSESHLIAHLSAVDALSGARVVLTQRFGKEDIRTGPFLHRSFEHSGVLDASSVRSDGE